MSVRYREISPKPNQQICSNESTHSAMNKVDGEQASTHETDFSIQKEIGNFYKTIEEISQDELLRSKDMSSTVNGVHEHGAFINKIGESQNIQEIVVINSTYKIEESISKDQNNDQKNIAIRVPGKPFNDNYPSSFNLREVFYSTTLNDLDRSINNLEDITLFRKHKEGLSPIFSRDEITHFVAKKKSEFICKLCLSKSNVVDKEPEIVVPYKNADIISNRFNFHKQDPENFYEKLPSTNTLSNIQSTDQDKRYIYYSDDQCNSPSKKPSKATKDSPPKTNNQKQSSLAEKSHRKSRSKSRHREDESADAKHSKSPLRRRSCSKSRSRRESGSFHSKRPDSRSFRRSRSLGRSHRESNSYHPPNYRRSRSRSRNRGEIISNYERCDSRGHRRSRSRSRSRKELFSYRRRSYSQSPPRSRSRMSRPSSSSYIRNQADSPLNFVQSMDNTLTPMQFPVPMYYASFPAKMQARFPPMPYPFHPFQGPPGFPPIIRPGSSFRPIRPPNPNKP